MLIANNSAADSADVSWTACRERADRLGYRRACARFCPKPNAPDVWNPRSCSERDIAPSKSSAIRRVALA